MFQKKGSQGIRLGVGDDLETATAESLEAPAPQPLQRGSCQRPLAPASPTGRLQLRFRPLQRCQKVDRVQHVQWHHGSDEASPRRTGRNQNPEGDEAFWPTLHSSERSYAKPQ